MALGSTVNGVVEMTTAPAPTRSRHHRAVGGGDDDSTIGRVRSRGVDAGQFGAIVGGAGPVRLLAVHARPRHHQLPRPRPDGGLALDGDSLGIAPDSPQFQAAEEACQHLMPSQDAADRPQLDLDALLAYEECMRDEGVTTFPDPTADGGFELGDAVRIDTPQYEAADEACKPLLPGGGEGGSTNIAGTGRMTAVAEPSTARTDAAVEALPDGHHLTPPTRRRRFRRRPARLGRLLSGFSSSDAHRNRHETRPVVQLETAAIEAPASTGSGSADRRNCSR